MNNKINILLISLRSDHGGGPRHVYDLAEELFNNSDYLPFIAAPDQRPYGPLFKNNSNEFYILPHRRFSILKFIGLLIFSRRNNINLIHSHGRGAGVYSRLLSLFGFSVIHTFHGAHSGEGIKGQIKLFTDKILKNLTSSFICVSDSEKEKATQLGITEKSSTVVIPNGINLNKVDSSPLLDLREKYKIPSHSKVLGCLTRLSYEKGNDLLLEALSKEKELSKYTFIIAGDGPDKKKLELKRDQLNLTNVIFIGFIDEPVSFLKGIDSFVSFSRGEGHPYSVLEALACNLPCVLSNVTGHEDFSKNSFLFDIEDSSDFSRKIALALDKKSNTPLNRNLFSVKNMVGKIQSIYEKLKN